MSSRATSSLRLVTVAIVLVAAAACVEGPETATLEAAADNQLAQSFESLSRELAAAGDTMRSREFQWTALAIRSGAATSRLEVTNNATAESYDAFVHSIVTIPSAAASAAPASTPRTLVAWRAIGDRLQVILMTSPGAASSIPLPASSTVASSAGATASFLDRRPASSATWIAVSGSVRIVELSASGVCTPASAVGTNGVTCVSARYAVEFSARAVEAKTKSAALDPGATGRNLAAIVQGISGVKISTTCANPSSTAGCP